MTARAASMPFPARLRTELQLDPVLLGKARQTEVLQRLFTDDQLAELAGDAAD